MSGTKGVKFIFREEIHLLGQAEKLLGKALLGLPVSRWPSAERGGGGGHRPGSWAGCQRTRMCPWAWRQPPGLSPDPFGMAEAELGLESRNATLAHAGAFRKRAVRISVLSQGCAVRRRGGASLCSLGPLGSRAPRVCWLLSEVVGAQGFRAQSILQARVGGALLTAGAGAQLVGTCYPTGKGSREERALQRRP